MNDLSKGAKEREFERQKAAFKKRKLFNGAKIVGIERMKKQGFEHLKNITDEQKATREKKRQESCLKNGRYLNGKSKW